MPSTRSTLNEGSSYGIPGGLMVALDSRACTVFILIVGRLE